jgi:peptidoglycan/xylan/chitin deacetylase (PgdA/CDA1 family)
MLSRRTFLATAAALTLTSRAHAENRKAQIAITLDLEMARNFPTWESTHWDHEKGNLDDATKKYALEAARRVKKAGGVIHFFLVGRALEQENVDWLKELIAEGHPVGNHTYDHVYLLARTPAEIQFRFARSPWLIEGKQPIDVIRENIALCTSAMKSRLGIAPAGFRTPGGFANGLSDRADLRKMLRELGFTWVSSRYPAHANSRPGQAPGAQVLDNIVSSQRDAQPFVYDDGLIEIPMSPISDIGAFRNGRWKLDSFLNATRASLQSCMDCGLVFDFLAHPACLSATDPQFRTIDLICETVGGAGERARIVDLDAVARSVT